MYLLRFRVCQNGESTKRRGPSSNTDVSEHDHCLSIRGWVIHRGRIRKCRCFHHEHPKSLRYTSELTNFDSSPKDFEVLIRWRRLRWSLLRCFGEKFTGLCGGHSPLLPEKGDVNGRLSRRHGTICRTPCAEVIESCSGYVAGYDFYVFQNDLSRVPSRGPVERFM